MPQKKKTVLPFETEAADFAEAVVAAREELGLTQGAFAQLIETPIGTVRGWEQGRRKPPPCAMLLMRVAVEHPEVLLAGTQTVPEGALKAAGPPAAKSGKKASAAASAAAALHEPGEDTDFWLL